MPRTTATAAQQTAATNVSRRRSLDHLHAAGAGPRQVASVTGSWTNTFTPSR